MISPNNLTHSLKQRILDIFIHVTGKLAGQRHDSPLSLNYSHCQRTKSTNAFLLQASAETLEEKINETGFLIQLFDATVLQSSAELLHC